MIVRDAPLDSVRAGNRRDAPWFSHPLAVRWWFVATDPDSGEVVFARGGRVRTRRLGRRAVDAAWEEYRRDRDLRAALARERFEMLADGSLRPMRLS